MRIDNNSKIDISVIIAVYNVELYIKECIDSFLSQTLRSIEIICMVDGSTDKSEAILRQLAKKDTRIQVYTQENQGVSVTRNNAMKYAKGEYVFIADSDDKLLSNTVLETLYTSASKNSLDILMYNHTKFNDNYSNVSKLRAKPNVVMDSKRFLVKAKIRVMPWDKLYKREYLESIKFSFKEGMLFEDNEAVLTLFSSASRVMYLDYVGYGYRDRNDSLSQSTITNKHIESIAYIIDKINAYLVKENSPYFRKYLQKERVNYLIMYNENRMKLADKTLFEKEYNRYKNLLSVVEKYRLSNEEAIYQHYGMNKLSKFSMMYIVRKVLRNL